MMLRKFLYILLGILSVAGFVLSAIQFVMAIRFGELGRVVVYLVLALLCVELLIYLICKIREGKQK